jgi:hypothetical protein
MPDIRAKNFPEVKSMAVKSDKAGEEKSEDGGFGARLLSGLKDFILEDDSPREKAVAEQPSAKTERAAQTIQPPDVVSKPLSASFTYPAQMSAAQANSPLTSSLLEQVMSRSSAYTALVEAMTPLEEIIPDEMTRYRAAFAVIKKNRSLDQVIQAIDLQHMQTLEHEISRFASQAKEREAADIDTRVGEEQALKANIEAAERQVVQMREELEQRIRSLQDGVQRDRQRVDAIGREIAEKRQAIAVVQRQFDAAAGSVSHSLQSTKAKILKYLTP